MPVRMVNDDELSNQEENNSGNNDNNAQNGGVARTGQGIDFAGLLRSFLNILPAIISIAQVVMQLFGRKKR